MPSPSPVPCLWFDHVAEEAARFYAEVFDDAEVLSVDRAPGDTPGNREGDVLTVQFRIGEQRFTGLNGGPQFHFSEAVSFQVPCADQREVDHYWERLGEGGEHGPCGWLKDRFGLSWQIVPTRLDELLADPDPARAKRALDAMLAMSRLDVAALERAADG